MTIYLLDQLWYKSDLGPEAKIQIVLTVSGLWSAEPTGKKARIKHDFGEDRNVIGEKEKPTEDNGSIGRINS
ncbi:hypothetical protein KKJ17_20670, partial [Xenorhabdus bovienii]|nr:hypothetical protein [Xenorhabdus bovienii]